MKKFKSIILLLLSLVLLAGMCACGGGKEDKVVVASKAHTEGYILGEIISLMIENNSDIKVERKLGLSTGGNIIHEGMVKGDIDMYPEYTGTGWLTILKKDQENNHDKLYGELKSEYESLYGLTWTGLYGFNNTYALTMRKDHAESIGAKKISDIVGRDDLIFGANPDYYEREDGYPGLVAAYGLTFKKEVELEIALKFPALLDGQADVINGFSTDAQLHAPDYAILDGKSGGYTP